MDKDKFIKSCFEKAEKKGFECFELFFVNGDTISLKALDGELSEYKISNSLGVNFRGIYSGKMGFSFSEIIDEETPDFLVNKAFDAAKEIESEDEVILYKGAEEYPKLKLYNEELSKTPISEKIAYVLDLEKKALALEGVEKVGFASYSETSGETRIINSLGLDVSMKSNNAFSVIYGTGSHEGKTYSEYAGTYSNDFNKIKEDKLEKKFRDDLVSKFGSEPLKSGEYKTVLSPEASAQLLTVFSSMFNAESVQKGVSLLKGKLGEQVFGKNINIVDDPLLENGIASQIFDSEGVACFRKELVKDGVVKTYMHNLKTAKKDGVKTTGNASGGYKSAVGISPSNLYIEAGDISEKALISKAEKGVYVKTFEGLHAGANPISGDFSLSATGYLIENGEKTKPVNKIIISGNYIKMLNDVTMISDKVEFENSPIGSPALFVPSMTIAG